jgi:hypothetical protein
MLFKFITGDRYLEECVAAPLPEFCLLGEPGEPEKELLTEDAHACALLTLFSRRSGHLAFPAQAHARFHFLKTMITRDKRQNFLTRKNQKFESHYMKSYTIYIVIA